MGSKDDTPGVFLTPMAGKISTLKLVYISGEVGCSRVLQLSSNWGCRSGSNLLYVIITDDKDKVVFPENHNGGLPHTIPGFTSSSPELLFTFSSPLVVAAGQKYKVWYSEDLKDVADFDNQPGKTCMKIIVTFSM